MPQTTIKYLADSGFEGMICDTVNRIIRGAIEGWVSDSIIPFGRAVTILPNGRLATVSQAGQIVAGIALSTDSWGLPSPTESEPPAPAYPARTSVNILTVGDIFVWCEEAVNAGDLLLVRSTAATSPKNILGRFAKTAGAGLEATTGSVIVAIKTTQTAGLVPVRVNTK